jgi:hypothetical protein
LVAARLRDILSRSRIIGRSVLLKLRYCGR